MPNRYKLSAKTVEWLIRHSVDEWNTERRKNLFPEHYTTSIQADCFDMSKRDLDGADLKNTILYRARLQSTKLNQAILENCDLSFACLTNASLRWANMRNAELASTDLTDADFCGSDLTNAQFVDCDLSTVNFDNAIVSNTRFIDCILPSTGPLRLRLSETGEQLLTGNLASDFFARPIIQAEVRLHPDRIVRKIMQDWIAKNYMKEVATRIKLVGAATIDGYVHLQFQGSTYRELYTFREKICAHFEPLEREDWTEWSACLTPKQRLEAIAAMMRDERKAEGQQTQLEKVIALELPNTTTIKGDAPASGVVNNYYISEGGKVIVGDDRSARTDVRDSQIDGSAIGKNNQVD
jgi:Pentapeptide repeats (8 copies)